MAEITHKKRAKRPIRHLLDGEFLSREGVIRNLPFLIFLGLVAIIYIANTYYAEKSFNEIEQTKKELKELRYQYITTKSSLMFLTRQTEIAKRVRSMGLTETTVPPYKIFFSTPTTPDTP